MNTSSRGTTTATLSSPSRIRCHHCSFARTAGIELSPYVKATRQRTGRPANTPRKKIRVINNDEPEDEELDEVTGETKRVKLHSGVGYVALSVTVDLMDLEGDDRTFVFDLIDKLRKYEREAPAKATVKLPDPFGGVSTAPPGKGAAES